MKEPENTLNHLLILRDWAEFAIEKKSLFFTFFHMKDIVKWTDEAMELIEDQEKEIKRMKEMERYAR